MNEGTSRGTTVDPANSPTVNKPVEDWKTADEPMTGPQASYYKTLCHEAGEPYHPTLTKGQASEEIERLQVVTGRKHEISKPLPTEGWLNAPPPQYEDD